MSANLPAGTSTGSITLHGARLMKVNFDIFTIPPCTQEDLIAWKSFGPQKVPEATIQPVLTFTDENGNTWLDDGYTITPVSGPPPAKEKVSGVIENQHNVAGCE